MSISVVGPRIYSSHCFIYSMTKHHFVQYVFGYGSLICPISRAVTAPSLKHRGATLVTVQHLQRLWSLPIRRRNMSAVGVRKRKGAYLELGLNSSKWPGTMTLHQPSRDMIISSVLWKAAAFTSSLTTWNRHLNYLFIEKNTVETYLCLLPHSTTNTKSSEAVPFALGLPPTKRTLFDAKIQVPAPANSVMLVVIEEYCNWDSENDHHRNDDSSPLECNLPVKPPRQKLDGSEKGLTKYFRRRMHR